MGNITATEVKLEHESGTFEQCRTVSILTTLQFLIFIMSDNSVSFLFQQGPESHTSITLYF